MKDNDLILNLIRKIHSNFKDCFHRFIMHSTKPITIDHINAIMTDVENDFFRSEFGLNRMHLINDFKTKYVPPMIEYFKEKSIAMIK